MKTEFLLTLAIIIATAVSCEKAEPTATPQDEDRIEISDVTSSSFTVSWHFVQEAEEYRCEVTYIDSESITRSVYLGNTAETSIHLDGLLPDTEYKIRVSPRANGTTLQQWLTIYAKTSGAGVTFQITPMEKYFSSQSCIMPYAVVTPSDKTAYYWVSAIPEEVTDEADILEWISSDISSMTDAGYTWDDLVAYRLILQGDAETTPFSFYDYGAFRFAAVTLSKNLSGIMVSSSPSYSHMFWFENEEQRIMHQGTIDDFPGEWMVKTGAVITGFSNGSFITGAESIEFPVKIEKSDDGNSLLLYGWGGEDSDFQESPIHLDYNKANDGYDTFSIYSPQDIADSDGTTWQYTSWFMFNGTISGQYVYSYEPYNDAYLEIIPAWQVGFQGYIGNLNKTVIKIFGKDYTDPNTYYEGASMEALWPCGTAQDGSLVLMDGVHKEPSGPYILTRMDVYNGEAMELPSIE